MNRSIRALATAVTGILGLLTGCEPASDADTMPYIFPSQAELSHFPAVGVSEETQLVIAATTRAEFMRPFLLAFQQHNPSIAITYLHIDSSRFFEHAQDNCETGAGTADLYLTSASDQLVYLANENCAATLPPTVTMQAPGLAGWRDEVVAFTVEPAVMIFPSASREGQRAPASHLELLTWMRAQGRTLLPVGTYDIETIAAGLNFAAEDSRQSALYGRLLESLGRAKLRLYCCSNEMIEAVENGEIEFAYNVQLSYAYSARRRGSDVQIILPEDYQALQTRSFMIPKGAENSATALQLAQFLVSEEGRALAIDGLTDPSASDADGAARAVQLLSQASVSPSLLRLHDQSRRMKLISDWREAVNLQSQEQGEPLGSQTLSYQRSSQNASASAEM